jgi:hypothetical protein
LLASSVVQTKEEQEKKAEIRKLVNEKHKVEGLEPITTIQEYSDYIFELYTLNAKEPADLDRIIAKLKERCCGFG